MNIDTCIVPATPGYFCVYTPVGGKRTSVPVIAWEIRTIDCDIKVTPITPTGLTDDSAQLGTIDGQGAFHQIRG